MAGTQKDHHITTSDNNIKTVPVTSVTPGIKTEAVPEDQKDRTRKLVATIAAAAIPVGKVATTVAKMAARGAAKTIESGEAITKTKTFVQGGRANIVEETPKKFGEGPKSPTKGTKVTVNYKTREMSPGQAAWAANGLKVTSQGKTVGNTIKGGAVVAGAEEYNKSADKKKK
jgi:hypothetical protein